MNIPSQCGLCPRKCGANRNIGVGRCGGGTHMKIGLCAPHYWEEPCISGTNGSGAVFFTGCTLSCVFCQNHAISYGNVGKEYSVSELANKLILLQNKGVHNINLVTGSHYLPWVHEAVNIAQNTGLNIPIVWNTGGYETLEAVQILKQFVNVWLFDIKFYSKDISEKFADAPDYFEKASNALIAACNIAGSPAYNNKGIMQRGVVLRLLVLPGQARDAKEILWWISKNLPRDKFIISLMSQYTPPSGVVLPKPLHRALSSYEYNIVLRQAELLKFENGYVQLRKSIGEEYMPQFEVS